MTKIGRLFAALHRNRHTLGWKEAQDGFFQVLVAPYSIHVGAEVIRLFNSEGKLLTEIISDDLTQQDYTVDTCARMWGQLYEAARRKALKVDEVLDNVLRELGGTDG